MRECVSVCMCARVSACACERVRVCARALRYGIQCCTPRIHRVHKLHGTARCDGAWGVGFRVLRTQPSSFARVRHDTYISIYIHICIDIYSHIYIYIYMCISIMQPLVFCWCP
jgi:hypothetical protein